MLFLLLQFFRRVTFEVREAMDSSRNIFTWLSRRRQTTAASDSSPRVPQSSSDSTTVPSPCGLVVSLELEQRGSEASGPAEALRSSPSKEDKAKSDAGGDTKEQESEGGEDGASDKGDRNESEKEKDHKEEDDCAALINIKTAEVNVQEKEGSKEKSRQTEFKYYLSQGGCKFGQSCKSSHSRTNLVTPALELNFLGLPKRPGEKECRHFMRTGICKDAANCRFNHPDPTARGGGGHNPPPMEYSSSSRLSPQQFPAAGAWSSSPGLTNGFIPTQAVSSPKAEWNSHHTAKVNVLEKEGSKEQSGQTEFKAAKLMVKEDEESEEILLQGQCKGESTLRFTVNLRTMTLVSKCFLL